MHSFRAFSASSFVTVSNGLSPSGKWRRKMGVAIYAPNPVAIWGEEYVVPRRSTELKNGSRLPSSPATSMWFHNGFKSERRLYMTLVRYLCRFFASSECSSGDMWRSLMSSESMRRTIYCISATSPLKPTTLVSSKTCRRFVWVNRAKEP